MQIENIGFLPTSLAQGETTREVFPTRVTIMDLENESFVYGSRISKIETIQGSGRMTEVRYIIHVPDRQNIEFKITSMLAGQVDGTIELVKE